MTPGTTNDVRVTLPRFSTLGGLLPIPRKSWRVLQLCVFTLAIACGSDGDGDDDPTDPSDGADGTQVLLSLSGLGGAEDSEKIYSIDVPAGAVELEVTLRNGSGDVDLALFDEDPTVGAMPVCVSESYEADEDCVVESPAAGEWFILLYGFEAYSGVTLTATVRGSSSEPDPEETELQITTGTTGSGYGAIELTPGGGTYAPGTRVHVSPEAEPFYEFEGFENGFCPGDRDAYTYLFEGCYVTLEEDLHVVARFEPILFRADPSVQYTVTSSTCTWSNSLEDMVATLTYSRRDGVDYGLVRVQGTRVYTSNQDGCTSSTGTIDASQEFVATGSGMTVEVILGQGASSKETLTLSGVDFSIDKETLGSFSYRFTGTDRNGSYDQPMMPWTAVVR